MANQTLDYKIICCQLNLGKSRSAMDNLIQLIYEKNIDIAYIQEPPTNPNTGQVTGIPTPLKCFQPRNTTNRIKSAIICANTNKNIILKSDNSNWNKTHCTLQMLNSNLDIVGVYCEPTADLTTFLDNLKLSTSQPRNNNLLIAGDLNARSPLWGDSRLNNRAYSRTDSHMKKKIWYLNSEQNQAIHLLIMQYSRNLQTYIMGL